MNNPQPTFKDLSGIFSTPKPQPAEAPQPLETENITTDENKVLFVPLDDTIPYARHSYDCTEEDIPLDFLNSIKENGVQQPALARLAPSGKYEIIAGHKRRLASIMTNKATLPVIVKDFSDVDADINMADSNKQRPSIKPHERAKTLNIKYHAIKRKMGARTDLKNADGEAVKSTYEELAEQENISSAGVAKKWVECGKLPISLLLFLTSKNFSYATGALLSFLPEERLDTLTAFMQANPKTKIKDSHVAEIKNAEQVDENALIGIFTEEEQEEKIKSLVVPKSTLQELFDDTELQKMGEQGLIDYIRKAIEKYREGESLIEI